MDSEIIEAINARMPSSEFVDCFVVGAVPVCFGGDRPGYLNWRREVSSALEIDPANLHVIGSACLGFSLAPLKLLRPYSSDSDIDVAVVSSWHFELAWRDLQRKTRSSFRFPPKISYSIKRYGPSDVFKGCIATDQILPVLPFAETWLRAREIASAHHIIEDRTVKFRLYRDLDSLRSYQQRSVEGALIAMEGN